jgi:hypothetical protein
MFITTYKDNVKMMFSGENLTTKATKDAQRTPSLRDLCVYLESFVVYYC